MRLAGSGALANTTRRAALTGTSTPAIAPTRPAHAPAALTVLAARHRSRRAVTDTETAVTGVVMMGLGRVFEDMARPDIVEDLLAHDPEALAGLSTVIARSYRASVFALGFAVHRLDTDAEVIQEAALLHDFAEMLLWCHAPQLALRIRAAQRADAALRSAQAQRDVLGCDLVSLQLALMKAWRLPELLVDFVDDRHPEHSAVRAVALAVRLARHLGSAQGWNNAALPDDVADIARLLNLSQGATLKLLRGIDG